MNKLEVNKIGWKKLDTLKNNLKVKMINFQERVMKLLSYKKSFKIWVWIVLEEPKIYNQNFKEWHKKAKENLINQEKV